MKYAIVQIADKQYRVEKGDTVDVDRLETKGKTQAFESVLLLRDGEKTVVGTPFVKGASVKAKVVEPEVKGKKLEIMRFKAKSRYRRRMGHRQRYTRLEITDIATK